jgi:hypothetical protein
LAIALRGLQLQVFAACLRGRFNGPAWGVTRHELLRPHGDLRGQDIRVTLCAGTIMHIAPPDLNQGFSDAGPGPCARDDREGSGASPRPCHGPVGSRGGGGHDRSRGGTLLPLHTRASHRVGRARWGRLRQRGVPINLADPCARTAVLATNPGGRAGAVAALPHQEAVARWNPAPHACPEEPGQLCRRFRTRPLGLSPFWAAVEGDQPREGPGPKRERQRDQPREDAPCVPPPIRGRAVGGAHPIAMTCLAEDVGARAFCDRIIPGQHHRSGRHPIGSQTSEPSPGEPPCRPASLRPDPMRGGDMARGTMMHGPYDVGASPAASRQESSKPPHEEAVIRRGGKSRLHRTQDWHRNVWPLQTLDLSWWWLARSQLVESYWTMQGRFFPPQKGKSRAQACRWVKKARHSLSRTSTSSRRLRQRQPGLGLPYRRGNARHGAPSSASTRDPRTRVDP